MTNEEIERLRDIADEAGTAARHMRNKCATIYRHRLSEAGATIQAAIDAEYGAEIERLKANETAVYSALRAAQAAKAAEDQAALDPGILVEWDDLWRKDWEPTGRRGRLEICAPGSKFLGNYNHPSIGETFLRILKKGGTPGLAHERTYSRDRWLPEGVPHPKSAQGIAARSEETQGGSAEGKSPVPGGDAP